MLRHCPPCDILYRKFQCIPIHAMQSEISRERSYVDDPISGWLRVRSRNIFKRDLTPVLVSFPITSPSAIRRWNSSLCGHKTSVDSRVGFVNLRVGLTLVPNCAIARNPHTEKLTCATKPTPCVDGSARIDILVHFRLYSYIPL